MSSSKVYFTKETSPEALLKMFKLFNKPLKGNIGIKIHSGEAGNKNFLRPEFIKPLVEHIKGTIMETLTAFNIGERFTLEKHKKLLENHGWSKNFTVDILDSEKPDLTLEIPDGIQIKKNIIGSHTTNYNSCLVIAHFKGHGCGGFGGALKQLSIGFASRNGKYYIHSGGQSTGDYDFKSPFFLKNDDRFQKAMADAATSVVRLFNKKEKNMIFINVMKNISVDCDCNGHAVPPCMKDMGILISDDPVAIDQCCVDMIYNSDDEGKKDMIERIESRLGLAIFEAAEKLGAGNRKYELINVDEMN